MKVSVIIVNYNGRSFVSQCIDSVLKSNYSNFEIIIVDNASTDGSYDYLRKKYKKNKRVKPIKAKQHCYFTGACNLGAKNAKGEKIILMNNDIVVDQNWIKELVFLGAGHPKYLIQPKILSFSQKNIIDSVGGVYDSFGFGKSRGKGKKDKGQYDKNSKIDFASSIAFMIDRKFFNELAAFDNWYKFYYEDVDLGLRAQKRGGQSWYCFKSVIYHMGSLTVGKGSFNEELAFNARKNRIKTIIKNFDGVGRTFKLIKLMPIYLLMILQDFFSLKRERIFLTINSIFTALKD